MDSFQSSTTSLVLSWIFSLPVLLGLVFALFNLIFEKFEGVVKLFLIWAAICVFFVGPFPYLVLQLLLATSYMFQSFGAFFSCFLLAIYIPIVFGILYAIGAGLPTYALLAIIGFKEPISKVRIVIAYISAPIIFILSSLLFYTILPYSAYSTHWLNAKDVIGATNGPPEFYYKYVMDKMLPLGMMPKLAQEIGLDTMSSKERLRVHVAALYLSDEQKDYYLNKTYPKYIESKMEQAKVQSGQKEIIKFTAEERAKIQDFLSHTSEAVLSEDALNKFRNLMQSVTKRLGRNFSKAEAADFIDGFELNVDYRQELGNTVLASWDRRQYVTTQRFDQLYEKMKKYYPKEITGDLDLVKAASTHQDFLKDSGGNRYPFGREQILFVNKRNDILKTNTEKLVQIVREFTQ